ncbi:MAG: putative methylase [Candidatus Cloacimonadota bacterium]|jgi:adenine-specific DNA methylase|nr:putative methylase [Candidatus Cloacimonadota bacterium]MDK2851201.1 putative methylase [Candidatus Cloacimonadota bacterium]
MIQKECKRLAEVDFPIAAVSKHAVREKSIHHGHPSTLHLWWARRPLASSRAMLMALLLPDPCDPYCPGAFKEKARKLLPSLCGTIGETDYDLQRKLLHFIADFANWDNAHRKEYLELSRALIKAAHPEETPLVVDPFAGGGSIPLEALRIGCDAFASDLNPVACLILKVMLEDIPKSGPELIDELKTVGDRIIKHAKEELSKYYPDDPDGSKPVAYIWARTVRCESPDCGAEIPLMRSFWLCNKAKKKVALKPIVKRMDGDAPSVDFEIFEPKKESEVHGPTVARAKATCLCCGSVLPPDRVRSQLANQNGGADVIFNDKGERSGGARLLAVITIKENSIGKNYRISQHKDYNVLIKAQDSIMAIYNQWNDSGKGDVCPIPFEATPKGGGSGAGRAFSIHSYGILRYKNLFSNRQLLSLLTVRKLIEAENSAIIPDMLALSFTKGADGNNALCRWMPGYESPVNLFSRQAIPIVWDFCESSPESRSRGVFLSSLDSLIEIIKNYSSDKSGQVQQADACCSPLPSDSADLFFTDPPYYDAIPYSDLSDFFFVWLKRLLPNHPLLKDPYNTSNDLTPKDREIVQDETRSYDNHVKNREFFENMMAKAFAEGRKTLADHGIGSIVFAHKSTEGWEALLNGITKGGWTVTGSWPIATEMGTRLRARESAALATSIHLVCRPRPDNAGVGDWSHVLQELPQKVGKWIDRLEAEGVRGADLVFSCIGPALEIFSRYRRVETAEGQEISIGTYLEKVWEVVGRIALEQVLGSEESMARNGATGALEEDARLTALFLWTLQSSDTTSTSTNEEMDDESEDDEDTPKKAKAKAGFSLVYDVARRFAQPLGIDLTKWDKRIIDIDKGSVRLIPVWERAGTLFGSDKVSRVDATFDVKEQLEIFEEYASKPLPKIKGKKVKLSGAEEAQPIMVTTLDKVHAAMLLQDNGQTNALRALIKSEMERGQDFLRLANSLSALYPKGCDEKRLVDAMLLSVRGITK